MFRNSESAEVATTVMNTLLVIKAWGGKARPAVLRACREIRRIEKLMSAFNPASDVSRVNREAGIKSVKVSRETFEVLECALSVSRMSGGAFDITAGPVSMLWKNALKDHTLPDRSAIEHAVDMIGFESLEVDPTSRRVYLTKQGMSVDLGGIAKGYAGDRAVSVLSMYGIRSALVDIGGNVAAVGSRPDGAPWMVGVQDPATERGGSLGAIGVVDKAVVTSGDYEQCFDVRGQRYHHIIDPRTGMPAKPGLHSASIIADTGLMSDALSTSVFVMGLSDGSELARRCGVGAIFVDECGDVHLSEAMAQDFVSRLGTTVRTLPG